MDDPQQPAEKPKWTPARVMGAVVGVVLGLCVVLGLNFPEAPAAQAAFLVALFLLVPAGSLLSYFHLKRKLPLPPKPRRYLNGIAMELMLLALGLRLALSLGPQW